MHLSPKSWGPLPSNRTPGLRFHPRYPVSALLMFCLGASSWGAEVAVLSNRTALPVHFRLRPLSGDLPRNSPSQQLEPGELIPVPVARGTSLDLEQPGPASSYSLEPWAIYFFRTTGEGRCELQRIALGESAGGPSALPEIPARPPATRPEPALPVLRVKVLVDEEEVAARPVWEKRLRTRVAAASTLLERFARVRLEVVEASTWQSDNQLFDANTLLRQFERDVTPGPARVAIGFTSQESTEEVMPHLGGTRGPLHPHILIREWPRGVTEAERLEVLLHELGHFLGAVHSGEPTSCMRPKLGDGRARAVQFRLGFDPLNTLAMCAVTHEWQPLPPERISQYSEQTRDLLRRIYHEQAKVLADDPVSWQYQLLVSPSAKLPLVAATRHVLRRTDEAGRSPGAPELTSDQRAERLVRAAADAAAELPAATAPTAFLLGLALAAEPSSFLVENPLTSSFARQVESVPDRQNRLANTAHGTLQGRHDWFQHFLVSAYLVGILGQPAAEFAGIAKELKDSQGGSGFSFADLGADLAGTEFAQAVASGKLSLDHVATDFTVARYVPDLRDLPDGLSAADWNSAYGTVDDPRFQQQLKLIRERIRALPPYRMLGAKTP